jgi:hypothetical protein
MGYSVEPIGIQKYWSKKAWMVVGPYPPHPHVTAIWDFNTRQEAEEYVKVLESGGWKPDPEAS